LLKLNGVDYYFLYKIREHGLDLPHKLIEVACRENEQYGHIMEGFVGICSLDEMEVVVSGRGEGMFISRLGYMSTR